MKQGWEIKKLGDVSLKISAGGDKPKLFSETITDICNIPVYANGTVNNGLYGYTNEAIIYDKCITISARGTIGFCCIRTEPFVPIVRLIVVVPKEEVSCEYLCYAVKNLKIINNGGTIPQLTVPMLKEYMIPVPERAEQERIVGELDCLSGIIANKRAQLRELDTLAQSIFYTMFGDPITNDKGWQTKKLSEISSIVGGSTPSTKDEKNWNGDLNWVTPAELNGTLYYGETQRKITTEGARGLELLPVGTVLLSSRAPIGKLAITTVPMYCNQGFKNVVCGESINNIYVYYYLLATIENVKALGVGATFKEVSKRAVENYHILVPPIDLQKQFAEKIENIERQKELITKSIKETEDLFNSRMSYYFD